MTDNTKTAAKALPENYYIDPSLNRIVKTTTAAKAQSHFYKPKVRIATTDEVLAFKEAGGKIETVSA